jgi:hypothetical protein
MAMQDFRQICGIALLASTIACAAPQLAEAPHELALHDLSGHVEHPSLVRGHPLLLHFGATW